MASVFLISSKNRRDFYPVYPLGAALAAHDLRSRGHDVLKCYLLAEGGFIDGQE
jgi:hypothetical protein